MPSKPGVPDALTARSMSATSIEVAWQATSTNHTSFELQRREGAATTWARVATPPASARSYTHAGLKANTRYTYRLRAVNAAGSSTWSAEASATTGAVTPPPPSGITVAITDPKAGQQVSGEYRVRAIVSQGVVSVQFFIDGTALGDPDPTSPYDDPWDTTQAANGAHTLTAVARTTSGAVITSAPVTVTVANGTQPPPPDPGPDPVPPPPPLPPPTGNAFYAALGGSSGASGTLSSPWDLRSALTRSLPPGSTLYLRGGTYDTMPGGDYGFEVKLAGTQAAPIHIKPYPGEHVIIDGGLRYLAPTQDVWIWGIEVIVSEPRAPWQEATFQDEKRQWGGLNLEAGPRVKVINCVLRDNCQGISWWRGSTDSEIYGCVFYDNGWEHLDSNGNHNSTGYSLYTQNNSGIKTCRDCIFLDTLSYTVHGYGEDEVTGRVDNYLYERNAFIRLGQQHSWLMGGHNPSKDIRLLGNWWYNEKVHIGYYATQNNINVELRDNLAVGGQWHVNSWQQVTESGNQQFGSMAEIGPARYRLQRNNYDPKRAHLTVFRGSGGSSVSVSAGSFLAAGNSYRLMDPTRLWGAPVATGTYNGTSIPVAMGQDAAAFVVFKG